MYQKGHIRPTFDAHIGSRAMSEASDMDDTEFEEDYSDVEEYSGRRSEESVSLVWLSICQSITDYREVWQAKRYLLIYVRRAPNTKVQ